jgi:hypothetical protein
MEEEEEERPGLLKNIPGCVGYNNRMWQEVHLNLRLKFLKSVAYDIEQEWIFSYFSLL